MFEGLGSRARLVAPVLLALLAACAPTPDPPSIPEPTSALRPAPDRGPVPADARIADYELEARLDAEAHRIEGSARLTWRNTTSRTVDSLPFHLYMNGFRAEDTAWMATSRGNHRRSAQSEEGAWGFIDVTAVRLEESAALRVAGGVEGPAVETVELVWSEDAEPSTMTVDLPRPVGPGESVTVQLDFTTQLPRVFARTGFFEDFHAAGQWYPKIGVLEEEAGWQAHAFSLFDEFYADFGNYRVMLDVPEDMIVGATGIRTVEEVSEGRKRLTYEAEMVHDFAWMADPDFVELLAEHNGVRIRQLIQPERVADGEIHLDTQIAALDIYESRYGPYPWSTITIVHPPAGAEGAGGMEYPTLFTTGDRAAIPGWLRASVFDERMSGVVVTIHEFGHQYFQGMLASREHLEPWLDEGINTTSNVLAATDVLGEDPWISRFLTQKLYLRDFLRSAIRGRATVEPIDRPARAFESVVGNYGSTIYSRTAAVMMTLRNLAGTEAYDRAFRVYCDTWRFRHPRGDDLEQTLVAELGDRINLAPAGGEAVELDVREYLEQALRTTRQVDFRVERITNRRRLGETGWRRGAGGKLEGGDPPADLETPARELADDGVDGVVVVHRAGAFEVPVEMRVEFADGGVERLIWDGRDRIEVFEWPGRRVERATLDPDHKLLLEWRRLDNTAVTASVYDEEGDGLSRPLGDLAEALSLALMGSFGP
ncbi:MAG: M1 family metallopeptidase [bacterium]|nr:M1 family metallopeptidase [bacterium]